MRFFDILSDVKILSTNISNFDFCVGKVCSDSSKLERGDIFVCRRGSTADGHAFIKKAHGCGVKTFVVDNVTDYLKSHPELRYVCVSDTSLAEVKMLDAQFSHPSRGMKLIGITGTNGKTSTAYMLKAILDNAGYTTGLIGTVKTYAGSADITCPCSLSKFNAMTTPSPSELYSQLSKMREHGCNAVVLEASSHALAQKRLDALRFSLGIFTNLSEDHLDYHKSFDDYRRAKAHLFELCENALINIDSDDGAWLSGEVFCRCYTYACNTDADFTASSQAFFKDHIDFELRHNKKALPISCPIPGEFTLYNALAAASAAKLLGVKDSTIVTAFQSLPQIPGRLEKIALPVKTDVFIDYAHTPDALEKVLCTLRKSCRGKLITVFGCGGNREREKRPIMGRIATSLSDLTIITSDNCRTEKPCGIIDEIIKGVKRNSDYKVIVNRADAIVYALEAAGEHDTVLLAGKGHEDYEITGTQKRHFSEREIVNDFYCKNNL